jgi:hypothetical protein
MANSRRAVAQSPPNASSRIAREYYDKQNCYMPPLDPASCKIPREGQTAGRRFSDPIHLKSLLLLPPPKRSAVRSIRRLGSHVRRASPMSNVVDNDNFICQQFETPGKCLLHHLASDKLFQRAQMLTSTIRNHRSGPVLLIRTTNQWTASDIALQVSFGLESTANRLVTL